MKAFSTCFVGRIRALTVAALTSGFFFSCAVEPSDKAKSNQITVNEVIADGNFANGERNAEVVSQSLFSSSGTANWLVDNCSSCHGETQQPLIAGTAVASSFTAVKGFVNFKKPASSRLVERLNEGHNCPGDCTEAATDLTAKIAEWAKGLEEDAVSNLNFVTDSFNTANINTAGIFNFPGNDPGYVYFPANSATVLEGTATAEVTDPNQIGRVNTAPIQSAVEQEDLPKKAGFIVASSNSVIAADPQQMTAEQFQRAAMLKYEITVQSEGLYRLSAYVKSGAGGQALIAFDPIAPREPQEYKSLGFSHQITPGVPSTLSANVNYFRWMHFDNVSFRLSPGKHTMYIVPGANGNRIEWAELAVSRVILPDNLGDLSFSDAHKPGQILFPLTPVSDQIALSVELELFQDEEDSSAFIIQSMSVIFGANAPKKTIRLSGVFPVLNGVPNLDINTFSDLEAEVSGSQKITTSADTGNVIPFETLPETFGFAINELSEVR